jgi:peptidyl-prolyl cis-trans isomerase SurA
VILKVTEHQAAGVPTLKDVEPQVQEGVYMEQLQPALRAYLTKLREDAYIDIKPGFVDSGASPKQTKPIMTAYTPPAPKKKQTAEKQRFDRGGRFSTAPPKGASSAAAASPVTTASNAGAPSAADAASSALAGTPTTPTPAATTASSGKAVSSTKVVAPAKQKKIKREKVRFGQAPRNSLPSGEADTLTDKGLGMNAPEGPGAVAAPGAAMAAGEPTTTFTASSDPDPLTPKAVSTGKTRYAARAKTEAATKAATKTAKAKDKAVATPVAATSDEKLAEKAQAAPLGLNGDTTKKKPKKVKGAPKERIQQKAPEVKTPQEPTPYRAPPATTPAAPAAAPAPTSTPPAAQAAPSNY